MSQIRKNSVAMPVTPSPSRNSQEFRLRVLRRGIRKNSVGRYLAKGHVADQRLARDW